MRKNKSLANGGKVLYNFTSVKQTDKQIIFFWFVCFDGESYLVVLGDTTGLVLRVPSWTVWCQEINSGLYHAKAGFESVSRPQILFNVVHGG